VSATHERVASLDTLRGVAMLGILPVNIIFFAQRCRHAGFGRARR
jgi:uncharacterized membrane protein YeiB